MQHFFRILRKSATVIGVWGLCLGLTEIILSFLPVSLGPRQVQTDNEHPYIHYWPGAQYVYSRGPLFGNAEVGRVNNAGFINPQRYERQSNQSLVAVIGDSYVEAQMLPYEQSLNGRLATAIGTRGRVYSFGLSNAPASQYLAYAHMVAEQYHPDYIVICINPGDFYQSLLTRWPTEGIYQFDNRPTGNFAMHLTPYRAHRFRELVRSSALARYFVVNMQLPNLFAKSLSQLPQMLADRAADVKALLHAAPRPDSGESNAVIANDFDTQKAADVFLQRLSSDAELPPSRIVLVFDASRPHIYMSHTPDAWTTERQRVMRAARERGFRTIDLQPLFLREFLATNTTVDIPDDGHWTSRGHEIVSAAIFDMLSIPRGLTNNTVHLGISR